VIVLAPECHVDGSLALFTAVVVLASIAAFGGSSAESARSQSATRDFSPWIRDGAIAQAPTCVCKFRHGIEQVVECTTPAKCQEVGGICLGQSPNCGLP
jgi:hypothetical protein